MFKFSKYEILEAMQQDVLSLQEMVYEFEDYPVKF